MKKLLPVIALLALAFSSSAQLGQILNGGLENWTNSFLYETPGTWTSSNTNEWYGTALTTKSSDAQHLSFSIRMENEVIAGDSLFGYFFMGSPSGSDLTGVPYSSPFDGVTGFYKCQTGGTDTSYVIVVKSFMGVPYPPVFGALYGNVSTWTAFNFPVPAGPCDSVFFGVVSTSPFDMTNYHPSTYVMIDNVSFTNSGPPPLPLPNPSFETWTTVNYNNPDNWSTFNSFMAGMGLTPVAPTSDAFAGTLAAEVTTVVHPQWNDTIPGILTTGTLSPYTGIGLLPYTAEPATFSCYYKYSPVGIDNAEVQVIFSQGGSMIGGFYGPISAAASSYTFMGGPVSLSGTPDSMAVIVFSGDNAGSVLIVDEFSLSGGTVGMQAMAESLGFKAYPNPMTDVLNLEWSAENNSSAVLSIYDVTGNLICTKNLITVNGQNKLSFDVSHLTPGVYSYEISGDSRMKTGKLIKQ